MHILSISGLHIAFLAGVIYWICVHVRMPRWLRTLVSVLFFCIYAVIAGLKFPVIRASCMGILCAGALMLDRRRSQMIILSCAAFLIIFMNPESIWIISFQLSFLSVLSLIMLVPLIEELFPVVVRDTKRYAVSWQYKTVMWLRNTVFVSLAIMLGTAPVIVYHFNILSFISVVANILIVPLSSLTIVAGGGCLIVSYLIPVLGKMLVSIPTAFISTMIFSVHMLAQIPWGSVYLKAPQGALLLGYYGSIILLIAGKARLLKRYTIGGVAGVWILCMCAGFLVVPPECRVDFLDTGYVPLLLVRTRSHTLLVNAGGGMQSAATEWILKPYLAHEGINTIDTCVITARYKKMWGGLSSLIRRVPIHSVLFPYPSALPPELHAIKKQRSMKKGDRYECGDLTVFIPSGPEKQYKERTIAESVCGVIISYKEYAFVIVPDDKDKALATLEAAYQRGSTEVVLVPDTMLLCDEVAERMRNDAIRYVLVYGKKSSHEAIFREQLSHKSTSCFLWEGAQRFFVEGMKSSFVSLSANKRV